MIKPVFEAVYKRLTATIPVTSLLSSGTNGVCLNVADENAAMPFLVFRMGSPGSIRYVLGTEYTEDMVVQFIAVTQGALADITALNILKAVEDAFVTKLPLGVGNEMAALKVSSVELMTDPDREDGAIVWEAILSMEFVTHT